MVFLYIVLALFSVNKLGAQNKSVYGQALLESINFELVNKSNKTIAVRVPGINEGYLIVNPKDDSVKAADYFNDKNVNYVIVNPRDTLACFIPFDNPTIFIASKNSYGNEEYLSPAQEYRITSKGKTLFLSYDSTKPLKDSVYPQKGRLKGISNRTTSGLLKKNNVTVKDIEVVINKVS